MRFNLYISILLLFVCSCRQPASTSSASATPVAGLALRPPMGWNSWNCFGVTVTEEQVRQNAEYMERHLKDHGWEYVVVDLGWYLPPTLNTETFKVENPAQNMDEFGRLIPDPVKFPSAANGQGFKPLADWVHAKGLKFGIHIMRGLPWQADQQKTLIKGTDVSCAAISNPLDTCKWYDGMYGVNVAAKGGQEYYNSLIELYTSWGVDYIKADDMSFPYHAGEIAALHNAIEKHGGKIVLSLSPGAAPIDQVNHLKQNANLWRISPDFWDHWKFLLKQFEYCRQWAPHISPGHWPDADMLPLGKLRVTGPDDYVADNMGLSMKEITNEYSRFTTDEKYTLMTLWSIFRSPLMMGGHLPETDSLTLELLTNKEVLELNQESSDNRELRASGGEVVWVAKGTKGQTYVALFNTNDRDARTIRVTFEELGIAEPKLVRDLWTGAQTKADKSIEASVNPHGAMLFGIY